MRVLWVFISFLCFTSLIHAQEYKIAAKVNNKVITAREVSVRAELMQFSLRLTPSPTMQKQLQSQALSDLIEEQLQLQELERFGIAPTPQKLDDVLAVSASKMGELNPLKKKDFLESLSTQLRARLPWENLVRKRFESSVVVTDSEVEERLQEINYKKSQKQYFVSEILLPVQPGKQKETLTHAEELVMQLRQGLPFAIVAQHLSKGPTAQAGGELGWVRLGNNEARLDKVLPTLKAGETSDPIQTSNGYVIYKLQDVKAPGIYSLDETYYSFNQVSLPENLSEENLRIHLTALTDTKTCAEFEAQAKQNPAILFRKSENIKGTTLPSSLQDWLRKLEENGKTNPIKMPHEGILIFMLCKKTYVPEKLPEKDQIKGFIEEKRFALYSAQYLKNLRKTTTIEVMD